jgi:Rrf2 family protein
LELARRHKSAQPVQLRRIAESHGIPSRFLVQILLQLKGAGLVDSVRGAAGGYRLSKAPDRITLGDIVALIEGGSSLPSRNGTQTSPLVQTLRTTWERVAEQQQRMLNSITLADLVQRTEDAEGNMYYI